MKLTNLSKVYLSIVLLSYDKTEESTELLKCLDTPKMNECFEQLRKDGFFLDSGELSPKGFAFAYKLRQININYEEAVKKGNFSNAQAAVLGTWRGFQHVISEKPLYVGSSAFDSLTKMYEEIGAILANATSK